MIGLSFESQTKFPLVATLFALAGAALVAVAIVEKNVHVAIFAMLPVFLAVGLWFAAGRRMSAIVHEDRLEFIQPRRAIPYQEFRRVCFTGEDARRNMPIIVETSQGMFTIPPLRDGSSVELYRFLLGKTPPVEPREPHPDLANYTRSQQEEFGSDRVEVYQARKTSLKTLFQVGRPGVYASLATLLTGVFWVAASFAITHKDAIAWTIWGFLLIFFGIVFWLFFRQQSGGGAKATRENANACLVISPVGIAMIQGDIRGKLRWDEVRKVVSAGKARGFHLTAVRGLQLFVDGSAIQVLDIYDVPLSEIEGRIRYNLQSDL